MRIAYDPELDDTQWREQNFSATDIASASHTGARQPTVEELVKAAGKYGPEGILESAIGLTQSQFHRVHDALKKQGHKV